ncbi:centrosomal protein POC5 isoform X3 [Narcine bancroftii]|uniref:centrosomal protein POC5 isoform X3 n=1 Tax=Narcine bancroftii TaxID=1343680 RepID=UPI0038312519
MSSDEERTSSPILPKDSDRGSSVSSGLQDEYEELLRYAVVTSKWDSDGPRQSHSMIKPAASHTDLRAVEGLEISEKINISPITNTILPLEELIYSERTPSHVSETRPPEMAQRVVHIPIAEENLDKVENILNTASDQLKANILSEIRQWRLSVIEQHKQEMKVEKEKHEAEIAEMACQTRNLNQLVCTYEDSVRRKDEVISNLIQGLKNLKEKMELMRRFTQWRLQHSEAKAEDYANILAEKHYNFCLMRKVCTAWKSIIQTEWKTRVEKACQTRAEEVCIQLSRDCDRKLNASKEELEGARAEIRRLLAEKDKYTDSMKKAFMRGVCALNLEAMSMFHNGSRSMEHAEPTNGRDDVDYSPSASAPQPSVCPVPTTLEPPIPFDSDRMITLHFGSANAFETSSEGTSTPPASTTAGTTSSAFGFQSIQKLPVTKCASSAQQKAGKTIVARLTGQSDPSPRGIKCGSSQGVSPPMTTICVERHHPVTQNLLCFGADD